MTRDDLVAFAREAIGTPFRHQGRKAGVGLDCAGLLVHVATRAGLPVRDRDGYAKAPSGGQLEAALDDNIEAGVLMRILPAELAAGDLVLMRFESDRASRHLGLCAGETLVHAWATAGKVCEHRIDRQWRARIVRCYRFAGVEE